MAANAVFDQVAGTNLLLREAVRRNADLLRAELARAESPLERIVADRVVMSWLQVHYADALFARSRDLTFAQSDSLQRRIDRAHRRLLAAAKALAQIRRMALSVLLAQANLTATRRGPSWGNR